jgi:hypothetical protein
MIDIRRPVFCTSRQAMALLHLFLIDDSLVLRLEIGDIARACAKVI